MSITNLRFKEAIHEAIGSKKKVVHNAFKGNVENYIGMTQIPTGLTSPLKINGDFAKGNYQIPLATTEGALVASYSRGAKACSLAGGIKTYYITEGVQRCPAFIFRNTGDALQFDKWVQSQLHHFNKIVSRHSNYAKIQQVSSQLQGQQLILSIRFFTGDAAGQNMVTICTQAMVEYIIQNSPIKILRWYIESNFSGDKKASHQALLNVRGRKVIAEVSLNEEVVHKVLKSSPKNIIQYFQTHLLASLQAGTIGSQGHFANGLAALFLATGQDVACVTEASIGLLNMSIAENGALLASITLPNLIVGTVGGGTHLATQRECLELIGCYGSGNAKKFAEITAALLLCGELSIAAAIAEGHFTKAHQDLGRK